MQHTSRLFSRMEVLPQRFAVLAIHLAILVAGVGTELTRRWRALRRTGDQGVESVEVAVAIALGLALALLLWGAYKVLVQKYINQVQ